MIYLSSPIDIEDAYKVGYGGPGYYFWDETDAYLVGPYVKESTAIESRERYFKELSKEREEANDE
jgi:hypothetical protein